MYKACFMVYTEKLQNEYWNCTTILNNNTDNNFFGIYEILHINKCKIKWRLNTKTEFEKADSKQFVIVILNTI